MRWQHGIPWCWPCWHACGARLSGTAHKLSARHCWHAAAGPSGAARRAGAGLWLDGRQSRYLVLWRPLAAWADAIYTWARGAGLEDSVTTVDELSAGDEVAGTGAACPQMRRGAI